MPIIERDRHEVSEMAGFLDQDRLLLLDHIASTRPPIWAAQWLLERLTIRSAGEHFTRRQLAPGQGGRA